MRIVVIGGGAGGASAAVKARRISEDAEVVIYDRGPHLSYANCGLPFFLGGEIEKREDLFVVPFSRFDGWFNIDARPLHSIEGIDRKKRTLTVRDVQSGQVFTENYDRLVLATGSRPVVPNIEGLHDGLRNVFTLSTVPDVDAACACLREDEPQQALVIGGGFIGLEVAEALTARGIAVTLVERLPQVMPVVDAEFSNRLIEELDRLGVRVILGDTVVGLDLDGDRVTGAALGSGVRVPCSLVLAATGMRPDARLAVGAGLEMGRAGGIAVNDRMQTSDSDIYAAGDCVESEELLTGRRVLSMLAGPANKQGRVAGANAAGADYVFRGVLGTCIVRVGRTVVAKTGLSEHDAEIASIPHFVSDNYARDHAGYYPGSTELHIKLTVESNTGRLLGAQVAGEAGVDKRIDVFATAIYAGLTVFDLEQLDLAYAPQFSSAKGPEIMAGMAASNIVRDEVRNITSSRLAEILHDPALQLVDVRTDEEARRGMIPGAVHMPLHELRRRLGELDPARPTVVYCRTGIRSYIASRILTQRGFADVRNLSGAWLSWIISNRETN
ncbi:MAG: FAD-dependent oxidoreductase [Clostridia bacterium]|nr:FAD-dependent oxidoreductase [Clostridia bacterium]